MTNKEEQAYYKALHRYALEFNRKHNAKRKQCKQERQNKRRGRS